MGYLGFDIVFHGTDQLFDLVYPIRTFTDLTERVPRQILLGRNFNRYYDPEHGAVHPLITIRVNTTDDGRVRQVVGEYAEALISLGKISSFVPHTSYWFEPSLVMKAHETGTECAIVFVNSLASDYGLREFLMKEPLEFMSHFMVRMLRSAGFQPFIAWTFLRTPPPETLNRLADACAEKAKEMGIPDEDIIGANFSERFFHAFLNCTVQSVEHALVNRFIVSRLWNEMGKSLQ
jgi:hypothetical protein